MSTLRFSASNNEGRAPAPDAQEVGEQAAQDSHRPAPRRRDAASNRRRILDVAERSFRDAGHDVPVSTLSARTGLAPATIYRHFPTRNDLVQALYTRTLTRHTRAADAAIAEPDALRRLERVLRWAAAVQAESQGCAGWFARTFPQRVQDHETTVRRLVERCVRQARDAGRLRSDVAIDDVLLALRAVDGLLRGAPPESPEPLESPLPPAVAQRVVTLVLRGLVADDRREPPPPHRRTR